MMNKTAIDLLASLKGKAIIIVVSRNHHLRKNSRSIKIRIQGSGKDKMSERKRGENEYNNFIEKNKLLEMKYYN